MRRLIEFFVHNSLIIKVFISAIFLAGLLTSSSLKRETLPEVDFDILTITTTYPGGAPSEVELNISKKIEDQLGEVDGLDKFISVSADNISQVVVWVDVNAKDIPQVKEDIRKAVDIAETDLPDEADKPLIAEIKTSNIPIIRYQISSEELSEDDLRKVARNLEDEVEGMEEVSKVTKNAYRDAQIKIMGDLMKMRSNDISLRDMADAIRQNNIRSGGGKLESLLNEQNIVTLTEFTNLKEIEDVVIRSNFENMTVKVKDVAEVKAGFSDRELYARGNKKNGIILDVFKKDQYDIIRTVDAVKEKVEQFKEKLKGTYGDKIQLFGFNDITVNTRRLLGISFNNAILGFFLVFLVLVIFLEFRVAFWTAFGIPMALMMVFIFMYFFDFSINNISLFGIITVLGILVDDGIVAAENIHRKRELGVRGNKAAVLGAFEVFYPILGSVLTTVLAFLPLAFMGGIMGKFIFQLPIVVIIALMASLLEVFFALPSHLAKESKTETKNIEARKWFQALLGGYRWILAKALRFRYWVVAIFILMLFGSFFLLKTMKFILFSNKETERLVMVLEGPSGINIDEMLRRVKKVEEIITTEVSYDKELDSMLTVIGNSQVGISGGGSKGSNFAHILIYLVPFSNRDRIAAEIVDELRKKTAGLKDFRKIQVQEQRGGPPVGDPVELKIVSNNDSLRKEFSERIKNYLKEQPGVFALVDDSEDIKDEVRVQVNYQQMSRLGANPYVVASTVRTAYKGEEVTSLIKADEEIDLVVQVGKKYKGSIEYLKQLLIPTKYGKQVPLGSLATFPVKKSQTAIRRYNGKRAITLTSQLDFRKNTPGKVMSDLLAKFSPEIKKYPGISLKVGGEAQSGEESLQEAKTALIFALGGIFIVLLLIFRSLSQPLLVLLVIPFGIIGVILSFKIHGEPFGFFALVGMVGLSGVVVNDSIVMVDFMNRFKKELHEGKHISEKVVHGASERLRPILLTTITTVMGLIPTVYGIGGSNALLRPLTMAMAYGLLFGTTITLFLIPSFYMIDHDVKKIFEINWKDREDLNYLIRAAKYVGLVIGGLMLFMGLLSLSPARIIPALILLAGVYSLYKKQKIGGIFLFALSALGVLAVLFTAVPGIWAGDKHFILKFLLSGLVLVIPSFLTLIFYQSMRAVLTWKKLEE